MMDSKIVHDIEIKRLKAEKQLNIIQALGDLSRTAVAAFVEAVASGNGASDDVQVASDSAINAIRNNSVAMRSIIMYALDMSESDLNALKLGEIEVAEVLAAIIEVNGIESFFASASQVMQIAWRGNETAPNNPTSAE